MISDEQITRMAPITGYKCAYCSYICTNAEYTQKHCILTHTNKKARINEGMIGESNEVITYIRNKKRGRRKKTGRNRTTRAY